MHKNRNKLRTKLNNLTSGGCDVAEEQLAMVQGGLAKIVCDGDTPYETDTATLNSSGGSDTQTDCTSKAP